MRYFHCKNWAVTTLYFRRMPYVMTNDKRMTMLTGKMNEKNCQNIKRLPLFLYF